LGGSEAGDFFQQGSGGFAGNEGHEDDFATGGFHGAALVLVQRVQGVIAAFDVNIRLRGGEKFRGGGVGEDADAVHALQRGEDGGAIGFGIHRPAGALQAAHGGIAIHADEQGIAALTRVFEVGDVAQMEDVKTAVGDDEFFAAGADLPPPCRQLVPGDDFVAEIHGASLPVRPRFANMKKRWQMGDGRWEVGFSDKNWVKMGSFSFFEKVEIGEIVNV
jgi:hypothetical protein